MTDGYIFGALAGFFTFGFLRLCFPHAFTVRWIKGHGWSSGWENSDDDFQRGVEVGKRQAAVDKAVEPLSVNFLGSDRTS